jgi:polygalacturonase
MLGARIVLAASGLAVVARSGAAAGNPGLFDVRSFGARGDGFANDTTAINDAIKAAADAGGGIVEFTAGSYVSGSIHLRSSVGLRLGPGATIVASSEAQSYDPPEQNEWGDAFGYQDAGHSHWHDSLIWGEDLTDVSITGPGRIFGRGLSRGHSSDDAPQKRPSRSRTAGTSRCGTSRSSTGAGLDCLRPGSTTLRSTG